jgi:SCY1-like protein 2
LLITTLYHFPHTSPIQTNGNVTTYKKLFSSSSTVPSQNNGFLSSRPLPKDLVAHVLPRLITRRPAQRMTAKEFQQSQYFDNILVSTIRFLDDLPAKTPNEKAQFMRGLPRIMPQFPNSVLEKKVLVALLEETKDKDLLSLVLQNVFKIISMLPSGRRPFTQNVVPKLREVFLTQANKAATQEMDTSKEAGLMVVLENMANIVENCSGKEFKDGVLFQLALKKPSGLTNRRHLTNFATRNRIPHSLDYRCLLGVSACDSSSPGFHYCETRPFPCRCIYVQQD